MSIPTVPPLHLLHFPTVGPTGERDNLERLVALQRALLPPWRLLVVEVAHDRRCPDPHGPCTCDTVDVTLRLHEPWAS
ncbi:MAG: hypothetical protein ABL963_08030 [Longimicrobiales bacterium]